ncbi:callose synthase 5 [Euphorbia peplus]|nr:callose synthase 5 [Euphorbia peplus]
MAELLFDNEVAPSSLASIAPILRIANQIEYDGHPRLRKYLLAVICLIGAFFSGRTGRFYALQKAHRFDRSNTGIGVGEFKISLLKRLERDNASSLRSRIKKTDAEEIASFYLQHYEQYVRPIYHGDQADRARLGRAYQVAGVLFEVLCSVYKSEKVEEVAPKIIAAARYVQDRVEFYAPYNIHPLDFPLASPSTIMQRDEVKAVVGALCNTRGLTWPVAFEQHMQQAGNLDILDWLRAVFDFQRDNVRNQREHLILLLEINRIMLRPKPEPLNELDERAVDAVMHKLFMNYRNWCKCLGQKHSLRLPQGQPEMQQRKILYIGLYLLIWGEASNVRFMPQCICYIFHNMACELDALFPGNVSIVIGENTAPSYGGGDESFLRKVITLIYRAIEQEGSNYDDLNEYFRSTDCLSLGWSMRDDGPVSDNVDVTGRKSQKCIGWSRPNQQEQHKDLHKGRTTGLDLGRILNNQESVLS